MNPKSYMQLDADDLEQISKDLYLEVSTHNGRLSKGLRSRLNRLPRHIRKELVDEKHYGCSSLFIACREGNVEIVKYLITECDANIEQRGILFGSRDESSGLNRMYNVAPLSCACMLGDLRLVQCLIRLGGDVNAVCSNGATPLEIACAGTNMELVQCLIENGADIHKPVSYGGNCLIESVESLELCEYLISKGANVNACDLDDETVLHYAVRTECIETIQLLLNHGANPFAKNRSGDNALQIASIAGSLDIVAHLMNRVNYPKEEWINAVELLGSTLIHEHRDRFFVLLYWRLALIARLDDANNIKTKLKIPPRPAYGNVIEFNTIAELDEYGQDEEVIRMQGLLIQERILGIEHENTLYRLLERGVFYEKNGRYQTCIELWMLALQARIQKHTILHDDPCDTALVIVELMLVLLDRNDSTKPQFEDMYAVFQLLTSNIIEILPLLRIQPAHRQQQSNYDCTLQCLTYLIYLMLSVAKSKDEHQLIESSVCHLVRNNIRSMMSNETLLHVSVSSRNVIRSEYFSHGTAADRIFPSLQVTKLLLKCGADVNAFDGSRSTPLNLASRPMNYRKELVRTLVEHGAHLDLPNIFGERPSKLLSKNSANDIPFNDHISLQCLCANVINVHGIEYQTLLPRGMRTFVQAHSTHSKKSN